MTVVDAAAKLGVDQRISDDEVVTRILGGEAELYEIIMRRHNQRIYRAVRAILGSDTDVEQVMQDAYVSAYFHLGQFERRSAFSTWLTKIAVHEALACKKRKGRFVNLESVAETDEGHWSMFAANERNPEQQVIARDLKAVLEESIEKLPEIYRSVLVLREIEDLDTAETAECLGITEETVKTRLHRARSLLRDELYDRCGATMTEAFHFHLSRCDRVVAAVFDRIGR
ncbi:MAG TPA: RNA polymerase sigma factor [Acidobacteriota bacterium]|nr:RNA polymerase sigma factor [Acidobacteriota bacterium]